MGCLLLKERLGTCFQPKVENKYLSPVPLLSSLPAPHRPNWQVLFLRLQCWLLQSKCSAPCSRSISLSHSHVQWIYRPSSLSVRSQQAHETTHRRKNLDVCLQTHLGGLGDHSAVLLLGKCGRASLSGVKQNSSMSMSQGRTPSSAEQNHPHEGSGPRSWSVCVWRNGWRHQLKFKYFWQGKRRKQLLSHFSSSGMPVNKRQTIQKGGAGAINLGSRESENNPEWSTYLAATRPPSSPARCQDNHFKRAIWSSSHVRQAGSQKNLTTFWVRKQCPAVLQSLPSQKKLFFFFWVYTALFPETIWSKINSTQDFFNYKILPGPAQVSRDT